MGKSEISVAQRDDDVCVVVITPPYRPSRVNAHTPPIESRFSSTSVSSPWPRQYLQASSPDQPAPRMSTSSGGTLSCLSIDSRGWLRGLGLNQGPSGYEPDELPGCSTPRLKNQTCRSYAQGKFKNDY